MPARKGDANDFGVPMIQPPGPLFERIEGPFERSRIQPTRNELMVAAIIYQHRGHEHPISISEIITTAALPGLQTERDVKAVVAELVLAHRCRIGSKRDQPSGYFWIVDAEDEHVAVAQYRAQLIQMGRRLRVIASDTAYREAIGQLNLLEA